jgi:hypothetical protein
MRTSTCTMSAFATDRALHGLFTFALASLPPLRVTELAVGNGVNFGIVLLARYVEERRSGAVVRDALWRKRRQGCASFRSPTSHA